MQLNFWIYVFSMTAIVINEILVFVKKLLFHLDVVRLVAWRIISGNSGLSLLGTMRTHRMTSYYLKSHPFLKC